METKDMVSISMTASQFMAYCSLMDYIMCIKPPRSRDIHIFTGEWISDSSVEMDELRTVQSILDNKGIESISVSLKNEHCRHLIDLLKSIRGALDECDQEGYDGFQIQVNERAYNFFLTVF